ncbi:MAG: hypothetical protein KF819_17325 [Labilithrix sp.]|nr:hypothetical protein [Labilithrix sp.]
MTRVRPKTVDARSLKLSPEEGFVLSRVDGPLSVKDLVALTGLGEDRVLAIVDVLATQGALELEGGAPSSASMPAARPPESKRETETPEETPPEEVEEPKDESDVAAEADDAEEAEASRNYRQIYETTYRPMDRDARIVAATNADAEQLMALCHDPDPQIVHAILANAHANLNHARAISLHHRTQVGLEMVGKRADFLADAGVQRRMLRNPQLPDALLRRIVQPKLIMDIYKSAIDREIPERTRVKTRDLLRKKFMLASADERAAFLFKTEGRCLVLLVQCAIDAHTTQILCSKNTYTVLFIQNLARWSACPPAVLSHLLKQQLVRRNIGLKKMILKHPNCPAEAKRNAF